MDLEAHNSAILTNILFRVFEDPSKVHNKTPRNLLQQDLINLREDNVTNITEVQCSTSETADPTLHAAKTAKLKRVGLGKRFIIQTYILIILCFL